uniref:Vascular endothelial growth factor B n=1 Tax=Ornithorhynchus anatinus TaxID=9258 RepID=A0A6I8N7S8_ORNAN
MRLLTCFLQLLAGLALPTPPPQRDRLSGNSSTSEGEGEPATPAPRGPSPSPGPARGISAVEEGSEVDGPSPRGAPGEGAAREGGVLPFQEVWGRSFCRSLEKLVEIVAEYPGEVEHMFSPSCVSLRRCTGCCGDESLRCVPVETANVTMQLLKIKSEEQTSYMELTFTEHVRCECRPRREKMKPERRRSKDRGKRKRERPRPTGCHLCSAAPPRR